MKEIIEINKRIMIEAPGIVPAGDDCFFVSRDDTDNEELEKLPPAIKTDLAALCARINDIVPNDFRYVLSLGDYNPTVMLDFCDGGMAWASCAESFNPELSLFDQLQAVDWDKHRSFGMAGSQIFDGIRELSKEIKPETTPASEIQQRFPNEIRDVCKDQTNWINPHIHFEI